MCDATTPCVCRIRMPAEQRVNKVVNFVKRYGWKGPVFQISALTREGCETLVRGNLLFVGRHEFLSYAKHALKILETEDPEVCSQIIGGRNFTIAQRDDCFLYNYEAGFLLLNKAWFEWKEVGLLALLLFDYYYSQDDCQITTIDGAYKQAVAATVEWCATRGYDPGNMETLFTKQESKSKHK